MANIIFYFHKQVFGKSVATFVGRKVGEAFKAEYLVLTVKHEVSSIMVWACVSATGPGQMFYVKKG